MSNDKTDRLTIVLIVLLGLFAVLLCVVIKCLMDLAGPAVWL